MATSLSQPASEASPEHSLWEEYRRTHDPRLRERLLERHAGLVVHAARRLGGNADTVEDLVQEGYLGLLRAIDMLKKIEGIAIVNFDSRDIVRHKLVKHIVKAYEESHKKEEEKNDRKEEDGKD